ncbi:hypothetical protein As57867_021423, partial [Aphanomyces stellatus]
PGLGEITALIDRPYSLDDSWRVIAVSKLVAESVPATTALCRHLVQLAMAPRDDANRRDMAHTVLRIREAAPATQPVRPSEWQLHVFDDMAPTAADQHDLVSYRHHRHATRLDRLVGVWGSPLAAAGLPVNYDRPDETWTTIATHFPAADYAFYAPRHAPHAPFNGPIEWWQLHSCVDFVCGGSQPGFATVPELLMHILQQPASASSSASSSVVSGEDSNDDGGGAPAIETALFVLPTTASLTYQLAWDTDYVAFAWDVRPPHRTFHFVASVACLTHGSDDIDDDGNQTGGGADVDELDETAAVGPVKKFVALVERLRTLGAPIAAAEFFAVVSHIKRQMEATAAAATARGSATDATPLSTT